MSIKLTIVNDKNNTNKILEFILIIFMFYMMIVSIQEGRYFYTPLFWITGFLMMYLEI